MTATEKLCAMLDERGEEYVVDEEYGKKYPPEQMVTWSCDIAGEDMTVTARDYFIGDGEYCLDLEFREVFTPEQAIAATLGARTCYPVPIYSFDGEITEYDCDECSECGTEWEGDPPNFCPNCGAKVVDE